MSSDVTIIDTYSAIWRGEPDEGEVHLNFSRIDAGKGLCDDDGRPVAAFRGEQPCDCWEAAFNASGWPEFEPFYARMKALGHWCQTWHAIAPGMPAVKKFYVLVIPRTDLSLPNVHSRRVG